MKDTTHCPMCTQGFTDRTDLRVHLMCDHRKSSITEELLTVLEKRTEQTQTLRERQPIPVGEP